MTARELALQILALPEDQQALEVHRADADSGITAITDIRVENAHTWTHHGSVHIDYDPFDAPDAEETKFKVLRLQ